MLQVPSVSVVEQFADTVLPDDETFTFGHSMKPKSESPSSAAALPPAQNESTTATSMKTESLVQCRKVKRISQMPPHALDSVAGTPPGFDGPSSPHPVAKPAPRTIATPKRMRFPNFLRMNSTPGRSDLEGDVQ